MFEIFILFIISILNRLKFSLSLDFTDQDSLKYMIEFTVKLKLLRIGMFSFDDHELLKEK